MMTTSEFETHRNAWESLNRLRTVCTCKQGCSDLVMQRSARKALFVGAERWDEFAHAVNLTSGDIR